MSDIDKRLDEILDRYATQADTDFDINVRYGRTKKESIKSIKQLMADEIKNAKISELKQLEPPKQFEDYAKLMNSEYCRICGFNAIKFRKYIKERIIQLNKG